MGNRQWDIPRLRVLLGEILSKNVLFDNYVIEHNFPAIGRRIMLINTRRIPRPPAKPTIIPLVIEDIADMDKIRMTLEKMNEMELFSKIAREKETSILWLGKEVNALLPRLGEKFKYNNGAK